MELVCQSIFDPASIVFLMTSWTFDNCDQMPTGHPLVSRKKAMDIKTRDTDVIKIGIS